MGRENELKPCKHPCCPDEGPCKKVKPKKPRARIRPVSKKQAKKLRKYIKMKRERFEEGDVCAVAALLRKSAEVIKLFQDCSYFATENHHIAGRIGEKLLATDGVKLCGNCHRVVEDHPDLAKKLGLSKSRLNKTA